MTDYEVQALEVARGTLFVYQLGAGIAVGALAASIIGGVVAFFTLRTIVRQLENAKWNALLSF
jgi:hypothetical protein